MSYDDWRVNGDWHKCECGASWSDSDGGPCHVKCPTCGELSDPSEADDADLCPKCHAESIKETCEHCGGKYAPDDHCRCQGARLAFLEEEVESLRWYTKELHNRIKALEERK